MTSTSHSRKHSQALPPPTLEDITSLSLLHTTSTLFSGPFNPSHIHRVLHITHPDLYQYISAKSYLNLIAPTLLVRAEVERALFVAHRAAKYQEEGRSKKAKARNGLGNDALKALEILEVKGPLNESDNKWVRKLDRKMHKGEQRRKDVKDMSLEDIDGAIQEIEEAIRGIHGQIREFSEYVELFTLEYDVKQSHIVSKHHETIKERKDSKLQLLNDYFCGKKDLQLPRESILNRFNPEEYALIWEGQINLWHPKHGFIFSQRDMFEKVVAWARRIYANSTIELATVSAIIDAQRKRLKQLEEPSDVSKPYVIYQAVGFSDVEKAKNFVVESDRVKKRMGKLCKGLGETTKLEWRANTEREETEEGVELEEV